MLLRRLLLLLLTSLFPSAAAADWPPGGRYVTSSAYYGTKCVWIHDLPSNDLLVRVAAVGGNSYHYFVQRLTAAGEVSSGWPTGGVYVAQIGVSHLPWTVGFAVDDTLAAWQVVTVSEIGVGLVDPGGVLIPGFYSSWPLTSPSGAAWPSAFAPAPGGIYAYWAGALQRMSRSGQPASGWPASGVRTGLGSFENAALADGVGGVVVMSTLNSLGFPAAQRFDGNAVRHAGWPAAGLALSDDPSDASADFQDAPQTPELLPSGAGHFLAAWTTPYNSPVKRVKLQRMGYDGVRDPAWPSGGVEATSPDTITGITILPDRSGGAYVLWYAHGSPRGTHVRADGTFEPGTNGGGVSLLPAGAVYRLPTNLAGVVLRSVPADVPPNGGLIFAWDDDASPRSIRVRWMLPNFTADPGEPASGRVIPLDDRTTYVRAVHAEGSGGAYVAWERGQAPAFGGDVWMARVLPSALVGIPANTPSAGRLALSAPRPNPARAVVAFDLSLPDAGGARVELLDVAGRVLRTRLVEGAGGHAITFRDLDSLAPGLYFVRATSRGHSTTVRVVVSR